MKKKITALMFFSAAAIFLTVMCVESPSGEDSLETALLEVSGDSIFSIDYWGSRERIEYTSVGMNPNRSYVAMLMARDYNTFYLVTRQGNISRIQLDNPTESPIMTINFVGAGEVLDSRLGWAGRRLYAMMPLSSGVKVVQIDMQSLQGDSTLTQPLDNQGPGRINPVAFDLADGGHQAWVLYESGAIYAYRLYGEDSQEGVVGQSAPGARHLHITSGETVVVGGDSGIFLVEDGLPANKISDLPNVVRVKVKSPDFDTIWAATNDGSIYWVDTYTGEYSLLLQNPEEVQALVPIDFHWIKNTRPFIKKPDTNIGFPPWIAGFPNPYFPYFEDPEGDGAEVTAILNADSVQNMYFIQNGDTVISNPSMAPQERGLNASFYGGDQPGTAKIRIRAVSVDGSVSERVEELVIQSP